MLLTSFSYHNHSIRMVLISARPTNSLYIHLHMIRNIYPHIKSNSYNELGNGNVVCCSIFSCILCSVPLQYISTSLYSHLSSAPGGKVKFKPRLFLKNLYNKGHFSTFWQKIKHQGVVIPVSCNWSAIGLKEVARVLNEPTRYLV